VDDLLGLILAPLDRGRSEQVRQHVARHLNDPEAEDDPFYLFREALNDIPDELSPGWTARCRWWLCLHVDWKAYDEAAWQVQAISRTLGLESEFSSATKAQWDAYFAELKSLRRVRTPDAEDTTRASVLQRLRAGLSTVRKAVRRASSAELLRPIRPPSSNAPTLDVLSDSADWLIQRGYDLMFLDTGGDEYLAVPVRLDLLEQARAVAERLGLPTFLT